LTPCTAHDKLYACSQAAHRPRKGMIPPELRPAFNGVRDRGSAWADGRRGWAQRALAVARVVRWWPCDFVQPRIPGSCRV